MSLIHRRSPQAYRPQLEELEPREVLSGVEPTPLEQMLLEQLNDIRANPAAYGATIGLDLNSVAASQPLAFNLNLVSSARGHAQDMSARGYFSHDSLTGQDPGDRIRAAGFTARWWAESIAASYGSVESALRGMIIDNGVPDLGHRRHLLAIDEFFKPLNQVGVGIVSEGNSPYYSYFVIDNAVSYDSRPFFTGVVINDLDQDGKYDIGEGLGQVTIEVAGVGSFTTFGSGGFSVQLNPGTYTVTFRGGGLSSLLTRTITVGSTNVRLTLIAPAFGSIPTPPVETTPPPTSTLPPATSPVTVWLQSLGQALLRRQLTSAELACWTAHLQAGGSTDTVVKTLTDSAEFRQIQLTDWIKATAQAILNRSLTVTELTRYLTQLQSGGSREAVIASLMTTAGNDRLDAAAWVTQLGKALLGRTLAVYEVRYWTGLLPRLGKTNLIAAFLRTTEHQRLDAARTVNQLSQAILKRTLPASEVLNWAGQLLRGTPTSTLVLALVNQADFTTRYRSGE